MSTEKSREKNRLAVAKYRAKAETRPARKEYWTAYNNRPDVKKRREHRLKNLPEEMKQKHRDFQRTYYQTSEKRRKAVSDRQRFVKTGMTSEMVTAALQAQDNRCAICRREFTEELRYYSDHCHDSQKPRGLLCSSCNWAEGQIKSTGLTPLEFGQRLHEYLLIHG